METSSEKTPYICSTCGRGFKNQRDHTGERSYVCSVCNRSFSRSQSLSRYMLTHSDRTFHTCSSSGKSFKQNGHLTEHITLHSVESPESASLGSKSSSESCDPSGQAEIHQSRGESPTSSLTEISLPNALSISDLSRTGNQNVMTWQATWNKSMHVGLHSAEDAIVIHIKTEEDV